MEGKMIYKFSKIKNNRLLNRVQMVIFFYFNLYFIFTYNLIDC